jgi:hypothetical protein
MGRPQFSLVPELTLDEIAGYHEDAVGGLRLLYSPVNPGFEARFVGLSRDEVAARLKLRLEETDTRSTFALLTSLEATFRIDFHSRCRQRLKDALSVYFRNIERTQRDRVRLDEHILEGWNQHSSASAPLVSSLRGAFKMRHWLAHGRYWSPKLGRKYDFAHVYLLASQAVTALDLMY